MDAARAAAAAGKPEAALRLISQYHYDFPDGELTADAEVVAIEVLARKSDQPEVARRAAQFLARYPYDPHATQVRRLSGRQ